MQRQAEADRKRMVAEDAIGDALDQAEHSRGELQAILRKPGGVFELLNRPEDWRAQIQVAESALRRARDSLKQVEGEVDPSLSGRLGKLEQLLHQDEIDRALAIELERIRMDR